VAKKALSIVRDSFKDSENWRRPLQDAWNRYYKLYRSKLEDTDDPWRSNLFIPYAFSTIETILPRLVTNRPRFEFVARGPEDKDRAEVVNEFLHYQWDIMNMDLEMIKWVKESLLYGTSILKVPWVIEKNYEGPKPQVTDLFNFFTDPDSTTIDNARYVIHRTHQTKEHLLDMQKLGIYHNVNKIESSVGQDLSKSERYANRGMSVPDTDKIELLEYWQDDRVIVVADKKIVIRDEKNPYRCGKPFVKIVDQIVPHEFHGIGEIEQIESLQYELNDWRNHRMDGKTLTMNPMWWVPPGMDLDDFVAEPGALFGGDKAPEPIRTQGDRVSDYREEEIIKGDIQTTTGVSDYSRGVDSAPGISNETATGISLIQEAANMRFRMKVMIIEEMGIKPLGLMLLELNQQFMDESQVIRVVGERGIEWKSITPEDIRGEYDLIVEAGSTQPMNEVIRRNRALQMLTLFGNDPDMTDEGRIELKKQVLQAFNVKSKGNMFKSPDVLQKERAIAMAQEVPPAQEEKGPISRRAIAETEA